MQVWEFFFEPVLSGRSSSRRARAGSVTSEESSLALLQTVVSGPRLQQSRPPLHPRTHPGQMPRTDPGAGQLERRRPGTLATDYAHGVVRAQPDGGQVDLAIAGQLVGPAALHALVGDQGDGADDSHPRAMTPPPARPALAVPTRPVRASSWTALGTTVMGSPEELDRYSGLTLAPEGRVRITAKAPLAASDRSGCLNTAPGAGSGMAASALLVVAGRGLGGMAPHPSSGLVTGRHPVARGVEGAVAVASCAWMADWRVQ